MAKRKIFSKKVGIFLAIAFFSFFLFSNCQGAEPPQISATSTSMNVTKMKASSQAALLLIEILNTIGDADLTLDSVRVTINATGTATTTANSFDSLQLYADDGDHQFDAGDTFIGSTSTVNVGALSTIEPATTTVIHPNEDKFLFVVLETSNQWTDNDYPEVSSPGPQRIYLSIASDGVLTSPTATNVNPLDTDIIIADTHSQAPDTSKISVFYDSNTLNYSLFDSNHQGGVGEEGVIKAYSAQSGGTLLGSSNLNQQGEFSLILGKQYYSTVWLSVTDSLGNIESSRVQFNLPDLPQISSINVFTDRIIFQTNKNLRGDQAMECSHYQLNGSSLNCAGPGYPFVDFFGNRVIIRGLNLTQGSTISFSVSGIQDIDDSFPLSYSSNSLTVQEVNLPQISSISPSYGKSGDSVTIIGTNFGNTSGKVLFSGGFNPSTGPLPPVEATISSWSSTQIVATVPNGAQSGPVQVITSEGVMSDVEKETFFDVLGNIYLKVVNATTTQPITSSDNIKIFIGGPKGENIYYVGDSHNTSFDTSTYVYTIPDVSTMGFVWAYDSSGNYLPAPGNELQSNTSTSSPQILTFQGTTSYKVSGTITLGTTCSSQGQNKWVAVMAMPEGAEMEMGPAGVQPSFFQTNSSCQTTYTLALPQAGTYRIESHLPPWYGSQLLDPAGQEIIVSDSSPTATANFTFSQADRRLRGRIVGEDGNPLNSQKYQELWIIAFQPKNDGKSSAAQADSNGYFDLYLTEGTYRIEIAGPMMPFPVSKDVSIDSSDDFALTDSNLDITIKLSPPTTYIEGYVKDGAGNGISDVDVFCWCDGGPGGGHAFTDSQGYYKMYVSPCSNYHIKGFAKDYGELPEQTGVAVTPTSNPTVNFTLSSENFVTVSGTVEKNASALTNAEVWLTQGEFGPGLAGSRTDTNGAYSFKVRKGLSNLYIHAAVPGKGEIYRALLSSSALNSDISKNISVNSAIISIHLIPGNTFSEVFIGAHSEIGHGFTDTRVSTSTSYDLYQIEVPYQAGGTQYIIDGGIPTFGPLPSKTITVNGNLTTEINLNSISFYTISGTVTADSGSVEDAFVWAGGENGGGGTRVNSDGTFSFTLREGIYDIGVGKAGYSGSLRRDVNVSSDISNLSLTLTMTSATISGTVQYNSTALQNVMIWAENGQGGWSGTVSEADGSFVLNVSPGDWKIDAVAEGYQLSSPLRVTVPASGLSGLTINLEQVDFDPERKEQSLKPTEGGVIQTSDTKIEVPSGALGSGSTDVAVRVQKTMKAPQGNGVKVISSKAKEISAYYSSGDNEGRSITILNDSANIEIKMTKAELVEGGISSLSQAQNIKISYYDSTVGNWVEIPTAVTLTPSDASWSTLESITLKGGTSHFSTFAPTVSVEGAPSVPTGLTAVAGDSQVTLSWDSVSGAARYYIYRQSGSQYPYLGQTTNTSYTDTGLTNGTTYYYKVSAVNEDGQESAATEAVSATPQASSESDGGGGAYVPTDNAPPTISAISVEVEARKAIISWQTNEPAVSEILYGTTTDYTNSLSLEGLKESHSIVLENLSPETLYHFQIKARDERGNESVYTDKTFRTLSEEVSQEKGEVPQRVSSTQKELIKKQLIELYKQVIVLLQKEVIILLKRMSLLLGQQLR